jgi:hypothetical protein
MIVCDVCKNQIEEDEWRSHLKSEHRLTPGKLRKLINLRRKLKHKGRLKVTGEPGVIYLSDHVDLMDTGGVVSGGAPGLGKKR